MISLVYWNGDFIPYDEVKVPLEDRGYLFADGVYEVIRVYGGKPFALKQHLERLKRSAETLEIPLLLSSPELRAAVEKLIALENRKGDTSLYIQLTRGAAPRSHLFPDQVQPNLWMMLKPFLKEIDYQRGVAAITVPDERWSRCYIKSIALLPNVLAREKARRAVAFESIMVRDGFITEGSSCNFFMVEQGILKTPPLTNYILPGITRQIVLELCDQHKIEHREIHIALDEIYRAREIFLTSATIEIVPVVTVDGISIGGGKPSETTMKLLKIYRQCVMVSGASTAPCV
jgi:D-alanine transaminase